MNVKATGISETSIGTLLNQSELVSAENLARAHKLSSLSGLPFGKCLVLLDCLSDDVLRAALEAQALLREGVIETSSILGALQIVSRKKWTLTDALISMDCEAHLTRRSRLGELLLDANVVTEPELAFCLKSSDFVCMPLGRILTCFNTVDGSLIEQALSLQSQIRKGQKERQEGIRELRIQIQSKTVADSENFQFIDLLTLSGVVPKEQVDAAILEARGLDIQLGQYLVDTNRLDESLLLAALCLYNLVCSGLLAPRAAAQWLAKFGSSRQEIAVSPNKNLSLFDFLRASGYLSIDKRKILMELMTQKQSLKVEEVRAILLDSAALTKILLTQFKEDAQLINSGLVLHRLIASRKLTVDQALVAFGFLQSGLAISGTGI
jgi:hypothetical protein